MDRFKEKLNEVEELVDKAKDEAEELEGKLPGGLGKQAKDITENAAEKLDDLKDKLDKQG